MARISALMLALLLLVAAQAMAADGDVRTCALTKVIECTPDAGCGDWTVQDVDLPRFIKLDLTGKIITSLDKEVSRTSRITSLEQNKNMIILHGTELRGWSAVIDRESGDLTLSAAGQGEGFIVFGSCIVP